MKADPLHTLQVDSTYRLLRLVNISSGVVSTLVGRPGQRVIADGFGSSVLFSNPTAVAMDAEGSIALVVSQYIRVSTNSLV